MAWRAVSPATPRPGPWALGRSRAHAGRTLAPGRSTSTCGLGPHGHDCPAPSPDTGTEPGALTLTQPPAQPAQSQAWPRAFRCEKGAGGGQSTTSHSNRRPADSSLECGPAPRASHGASTSLSLGTRKQRAARRGGWSCLHPSCLVRWPLETELWLLRQRTMPTPQEPGRQGRCPETVGGQQGQARPYCPQAAGPTGAGQVAQEGRACRDPCDWHNFCHQLGILQWPWDS